MNLYSPPNGGHPQELPNRWRFDDGTVRTDLKLLSNSELSQLGWTGPIVTPTPLIIKFDKNGDPILDEDGNPVKEGDFNPETHKAVWYRAKRQYVILENHIDESIYDSGELLPEDIAKLPDWDNFETIVLQSKEIKEFISYASIQNSLVAATFPAAFFEAKTGKYNSFYIVWNELIKISPVDSIVIQSIVAVAKSCHLPEEFIKIIEDTLALIQDEDGNDTLAKMPDWDTFEGLVLQSTEMIEFITFAATKNPLVASAFPAAFYEAKNGKYGSFKTVWNELVNISPVDVNVSASIIAVAKSCNLPQDFISIVEG